MSNAGYILPGQYASATLKLERTGNRSSWSGAVKEGLIVCGSGRMKVGHDFKTGLTINIE